MRKWLRDVRIQMNLSQTDVAHGSNITQQAYSFIETGARVPSVSTAKAIADKLNIDWQLFFQDNKTA